MSNINIYLKQYKQKGDLAYEYNPFKNYKESVEIDNNQYKSILTDFNTDKLNFDINHPVDIEVQPSYDGSVNLILNDDKNIPRLINSRFSVREMGTYEIVDRIGENDTNIYGEDSFDSDTSVYFKYNINPKIKYSNYIDGNFPVGQYCFYITYCDSDGNESDYISETGVIPLFIGTDNNPSSMDGGIKNQNSNKGVSLLISDLDYIYNYIKIYYIRYFADYEQNRVVEFKGILNKYAIKSSSFFVNITGSEDTENLDPNILNISQFNPKHILTQAQCKNILFFGNVTKNVDNYKELQDLALRIIPSIEISSINNIDNDYSSDSSDFGYYNSYNMYNKVGYMDQEYYRFGVVFIYQDGTLSNVYNTLGLTLSEIPTVTNCIVDIEKEENDTKIRQYIQCDDDGWIQRDQYNVDTQELLNNKGVCRIKLNRNINDSEIINIKFSISGKDNEENEKIINFLKNNLNIRGLFFVRQKRIPNILTQCYLLPIDEVSGAPLIEISGTNNTYKYLYERFVIEASQEEGSDTIIDNDYNKRLEEIDNLKNPYIYAAICPDFLLNQPYYNQVFNGSDFYLQQISPKSQSLLNRNKKERFYNAGGFQTQYSNSESRSKATLCTVTEDVPIIAIKDQVFRIRAGETEEAYKFEFVGADNSNKDNNKYDNIIRGMYSPFIAVYSTSKLSTSCLYNIFTSSNDNVKQNMLDRMQSSQPFYAISDRYNFDQFQDSISCFRGDCYINTFTYRLNRNFNDPTLPNNDKIIVKGTWDNYYNNYKDIEKWADISRSDVNAVQLGSWITFKVRSPFNYALRSEDHSYVAEEALMGAPRSFYPRKEKMWLGTYKMPDSYLYNDAYRATLGFKCYFALQDVNYIKDNFSNRIQYSEIAIQDSYKNNYRSSLSTYHKDYSSEYGAIIKLVSFEGYLLVVFEHGIGIATVNERILVGSGEGNPVFINTKNVLPDELVIVSDSYGTQWGESVIKSEAGYVYGVDTVAKKIWRVKGQQIEILSDFKVNKFLVDNISLTEREKTPFIGLKNVKTHYNANKKDIMFTFYDDVFQDEEKVWNLCYNELLDQFVTFYSWLPSYSANIDNQFFSFDRNTSKYLSLVNKSNPEFSNKGILCKLKKQLKNENYYDLIFKYYAKNDIQTYKDYDGNLYYYGSNIDNEKYEEIIGVEFKLNSDHWSNYRKLKKLETSKNVFTIEKSQLKDILDERNILLLNVSVIAQNNTITLATETVAVTDEEHYNKLTTDFYVHGRAGIFDVKENIYPCKWYGEEHPFEFEFVVNDKIGQQKIFENLEIIANKAEPESFHFEVEGDNYDFSSDKRAMYFRQEATKELYQNLGSNILFDRKYTDIVANGYTHEQYYRGGENYQYVGGQRDKIYPKPEFNLVQQVKSSIFPLYYNRIDTYNNIYDDYQLMTGNSRDYQNLSGSEIIWNRDLNQFDVVTHIKNSPIDHVGRLRGNSRYKEGKWSIQIPSIIFNQKNEENWDYYFYNDGNYNRKHYRFAYKVPPLVLNNIPKDISKPTISTQDLPNTYEIGQVRLDKWTFRKESRIRDKWIKIKVRYSGRNLAVIHSIITLYNISYS